MGLVKKAWMPSCAMKRVICHWTVGRYQASSVDLAHYHLLIEGDGKPVRGTHSIADNVSTADGVYAAHTARCNTGSIGVSCCSMLGARESPFDPGPFPLKEVQWEAMAQVVAELCQFYQIPVTPQTVLGHGEVTVNLGIPQSGKWDPMVLPWEPGMSRTQVGTFLRSLVRNHVEGGPTPDETPASLTVVIRGRKFTDALISNETSWVKIRPVADAFQWTITHADARQVVLQIAAASHTLAAMILSGSGYVACRDLAEALSAAIEWDAKKRTVSIT